MNKPLVYRLKDVMEILHLSRTSVTLLLVHGKLKHVKAGRIWLIPEWAINEYLAGDESNTKHID